LQFKNSLKKLLHSLDKNKKLVYVYFMLKRLVKILVIGFIWGSESVISNSQVNESATSTFVYHCHEPEAGEFWTFEPCVLQVDGTKIQCIPEAHSAEGYSWQTLHLLRNCEPGSHSMNYYYRKNSPNQTAILVATGKDGLSFLCVSRINGAGKVEFYPVVRAEKDKQYFVFDPDQTGYARILYGDKRYVNPDFVPATLPEAQKDYIKRSKTPNTPLQG
jgi:hypothetical protein